jgi:hypothetical protein
MKNFFYVLLICPLLSYAQNDRMLMPIKNFTVGLHYASIFAHSEEVQNTRGANPVGVEFLYTIQKRAEKDWQVCNCYLNQGLGLNYFNYDNKILGHSLSLLYNFEPHFKLSKDLNLILSVNSGLSYLSNPYDINNNPTNRSYSLPLSIYVGLGTGLQYRVNHKLQIGILGHYLHISNGGIKDPNKGINWPSANIRLVYSANSNNLPDYQKSKLEVIKKNRFDVGLFVSSKTLEVGDKERFLIYGLNTTYSRQVSNLNALSLGVELIYDNATKERLSRLNESKNSSRSGLLIGHEFLLGKFIFSQQLGYYLYIDTKFFNHIYQRWGISYTAKNNFALGVNLLAHAQVANFLDFRITYNLFHKK